MPLFLLDVINPAVGGTYSVVLDLAVRKLLQISAGSVDAPYLVLAVSAGKAEIEDDIAAVGASVRVSAGLAFHGRNRSSRPARHIDTVQHRVLVSDHVAVFGPGQVRGGFGRGYVAALRNRTRRWHHKHIPAALAQHRAQGFSTRGDAQVKVVVGVMSDGSQLAVAQGEVGNARLVEVRALVAHQAQQTHAIRHPSRIFEELPIAAVGTDRLPSLTEISTRLSMAPATLI